MGLQTDELIHFAPMQGFTDFVYRECYHRLWASIDQYYIPYLSIAPGKKIRNVQRNDVADENNLHLPVIPQILVANANEVRILAKTIKVNHYAEINLNLGCPYPMATKRGRGAALLENTDQLKNILDILFDEFQFDVSIKLRSGLNDPSTCLKQLGLFNHFPIKKLTLHPRTADQMYKGKTDLDIFKQFKMGCRHPVVYNGDIICMKDFLHLKTLFPEQREWMIGRGILMNPFLPELIKGNRAGEFEKIERLRIFHDAVFQKYQEKLTDNGYVLNKMQQFWIYFSHNFLQQKKVFKIVKKTNSFNKYQPNVQQIFNRFLINL